MHYGRDKTYQYVNKRQNCKYKCLICFASEAYLRIFMYVFLIDYNLIDVKVTLNIHEYLIK